MDFTEDSFPPTVQEPIKLPPKHYNQPQPHPLPSHNNYPRPNYPCSSNSRGFHSHFQTFQRGRGNQNINFKNFNQFHGGRHPGPGQQGQQQHQQSPDVEFKYTGNWNGRFQNQNFHQRGRGRGGRPFTQHPRGPNPNFQNRRGRGQGANNNFNNFYHNAPSNNQEQDSPWITPELLKMIEEKDQLWDKYSAQRTEESHRSFKIKRFEVSMAVNDAKILYYQKNPNQGNYQPYCKAAPWTPKSISTPQPREFYCDPCDKDFKSEEMLEEHKAEHLTCKLDGCTYTAHAKLVMKHIELQHSTNLFHRIKGYDTPEEIEKWKQERRHNFPTPQNILRKQAEREERRNRGESMNLSSKHSSDLLGTEVFRYKILPEKRTPRFIPRGEGYQSDGDEEMGQPEVKRFRSQSQEEQYRPGPINRFRFSSLNQSSVVKLLNFYTDIELSSGRMVGSTRECWSKRDNNENNGIASKSNEDEDKDTEFEFNITDDEEESCSVRVIPVVDDGDADEEVDFSVVTVPNSIAIKFAQQSTSSDDKNGVGGVENIGLAGLVNYYSDSEAELDEDVVDEDNAVKSDGEVSSSESELTLLETTPRICRQSVPSGSPRDLDPPLSSDEEGPDELPAVKSMSAIDDTAVCERVPEVSKASLVVLEDTNVPEERQFNRRKRKRGKFQQNDRRNGHREQSRKICRKYSLLQRLLAPDIRQEKNIVLQVCRFVVDKNFFDPPDVDTDSTKDELISDDSPVDKNDLKV